GFRRWRASYSHAGGQGRNLLRIRVSSARPVAQCRVEPVEDALGPPPPNRSQLSSCASPGTTSGRVRPRYRADREPEEAADFVCNGGVLPLEGGRGGPTASDDGSEPARYHSNDFICEQGFWDEQDRDQGMEQSDSAGTIGTLPPHSRVIGRKWNRSSARR